jgi:hypothetical protein
MSGRIDFSVLDWLVKRWTANFDEAYAVQLTSQYENLKSKHAGSIRYRGEFCRFMDELIRDALLDHDQAWQLAQAAIDSIFDPDAGFVKSVIERFELLEYLGQWRMRFENNQQLERRLAEVQRINAQMSFDELVLNQYKQGMSTLCDSEGQLIARYEANGQRILRDLTKLAHDLSAELVAKRKPRG